MIHPKLTPEIAAQAAKQLSKNDPLLVPVIKAYGPCTIAPHTDYYRQLVRSIIGQQLSVKAAASITARFLELFDGNFPEPADILKKDVETLRGVGFSRAKASYVLDLAERVIDGRLTFNRFDEMENDDITRELVAVKGVGEWTAHMFMMWAMGRTDILPVGDLGVRAGMQKIYGFPALPSPTEMRELADARGWSPYESIASWYMWRVLENEPQ